MAVITVATTTLVARVTNVETVTCMIGVDPGSQTRVWELETSPSLEYYAYDHSEVSSRQKKRFEQMVRVGCAALVLKAVDRLRQIAIARAVLVAQSLFSARMSVVSPFHGNDIHVISDSYLKMLGELGVVPWDWEKAESACKEVLLRVDDWF